MGEVEHGDFIWVPKVYRPVETVLVHHANQAFDEVRDVLEGSGCGTVTCEREGASEQRLNGEVAHDAAVIEGHPRAVRVEDAYDPDVDTLSAKRVETQRFSGPFALVVAGARRNGVHMPHIRFALRVFEWVAVHLGGRGLQDAGTSCPREVEEICHADDTCEHRPDRVVLIVDRACGAREVEDAVYG